MLHFTMLARGVSRSRMERHGSYLFISVASELKNYIMFGSTVSWEKQWDKYM